MSYDPGNPGDRPQQPPGGQGWPGGQQQPQFPPGYGQQPPPGWVPPGGPAGGPAGPPPQRSFFSALFDYSFTSFATPGLIRLIYIIGTVLIALGWLGYVITTFMIEPALGVVTLIVGGVVALFMLALLRVSLEFYYAVVRMSEDIHNRR